MGAPVSGPVIVGWVAAALLAMTAGILAALGVTEDGLRMLVRATARTSLALFLAVFTASSLLHHWPRDGTRWLMANRRWVGLSFAVSHLLHLLALLGLAGWFPTFSGTIGWVTLAVGGAGFVVVAVLAATSSDRAVARLGRRRWERLHRAGVYYLWGVFTLTYLGRSVTLTGLLLAALVLRLARR